MFKNNYKKIKLLTTSFQLTSTKLKSELVSYSSCTDKLAGIDGTERDCIKLVVIILKEKVPFLELNDTSKLPRDENVPQLITDMRACCSAKKFAVNTERKLTISGLS